jgi:uncharacterized protein (TIGR03435 family)
MRQAVPLREGREVEALRRLERLGEIRKPLELLLSPVTLEPGIFGIVKPVLVWPAGISEHLQDAHLEAIVAHEVWHVRRSDNLAAAIHMVVEAIFWFHPLVWWLGARLVEERERACDEEVLELGSERHVYAESILKTCEFCVESPLACVSGVTGADLKKRIVRIMTERMANELSFGRKLLLAALGIAVIAGPVVFGLMNAPQIRAQSTQTIGATLGQTAPSNLDFADRYKSVCAHLPKSFCADLPKAFEVASIRPGKGEDRSMRWQPGRFIAINVTLELLIGQAYNLFIFRSPGQPEGLPSWAKVRRYTIQAEAPPGLAEKLEVLPTLPPDQRKDAITACAISKMRMLQSLLADRFKLKVHRVTRQLPLYEIFVAKGGPKLKPFNEAELTSGHGRGFTGREGGEEFVGVDLPLFARFLSDRLGQTVIDKTGLTGSYDFTLTVVHWRAGMGGAGFGGSPGLPEADASGPSIFTAIQEQLGLKLESTKGPVEVIVIDHVEKPSEN